MHCVASEQVGQVLGSSGVVGEQDLCVVGEPSELISSVVIDSRGCVTEDMGMEKEADGPREESRFYEVEVDELSDTVSVKGRLCANIVFWKEVLHASPAVLNIIEAGYVLPLMSEPTPFSARSQMSALQNVDFVDQCIEQLLNGECIKELKVAPHICSPLSVVENNAGKRGWLSICAI